MKSAVCYEPCGSCPFRTDRPSYLTKSRAREIIATMKHDQDFKCHKTLDYDTEDGEGQNTERTAICAGFAVIAETAGTPTQMMRIAERMGMYDKGNLNMDAPVYKTARAFIGAMR